MLNSIKEKIINRLRVLFKSDPDSPPRQIAMIIAVTVALAFLLWLVVNLNRAYTIDIKVPLILGQVSSERALSEELPDYITASVSGEGWYLLSAYRDPQPIFIEVNNEQVNLFEQVRRQFQTASKLQVQKVDPLYLRVQLEEKVSKKVPVIARVETNFAEQYSFLEAPEIQPDSITVTGAQSIVNDINHWLTDSLKLKNIKSTVSVEIPLQESGQLINLSEQDVEFTAEVAQFTEGTVTVPVELRNAGTGSNVIFSPQKVEITFLAPIDEFPAIEGSQVFSAYVTYAQLLEDTTGFVSPQVEQIATDAHLKVQQMQPRQVGYFTIINVTD